LVDASEVIELRLDAASKLLLSFGLLLDLLKLRLQVLRLPSIYYTKEWNHDGNGYLQPVDHGLIARARIVVGGFVAHGKLSVHWRLSSI
jgi:hypothetical protein